MTFPRDKASRIAERAKLARQTERGALQAAENYRYEFAGAGMSLKCRGDVRRTASLERLPWHANEQGGCTNDGTGCICECHDETSEEPA